MRIKQLTNLFNLALTLVAALLLSSCNELSDSGSAPVGTKSQVLQIRMHDLPISGEEVEKVIVGITGLEVHHAELGWMSIPFEPQRYDLLELQNGASVIIFEQPLEPGKYTQIRLNVSENNELYIGGQSYPLRVPSGEQTGVKLITPFEIERGKLVEVTLDFNVQHSVKIVRDQGFLKPVIKVESIAEYDGAGLVTTEGGYVSSFNGDFNITVPANATSGTIVLSMNEVNPATLPGPLPENTILVGRVYDLEPEGYTFSTDVTLEIPYDEAAISQLGAEEDLFVVTYNEELDIWEPVPTTVITSANVVQAQLSHFSIYGLALKKTEAIIADPLIGSIDPFAAAISLVSIAMDISSNEQRNEQRIELLNAILVSIKDLNDDLIALNCDLFYLNFYSNLDLFKNNINDYYNTNGREIFLDDIWKLAYDSNEIMSKLHDPDNFASECQLFDQHKNFELYVEMMALNIELKAEYIRVNYIDAVLDGNFSEYANLLNDDEINGTTLAEEYIQGIEDSVNEIIYADSQDVLASRVNDVFTHMELLDNMELLSDYGEISYKKWKDAIDSFLFSEKTVVSLIDNFWDYDNSYTFNNIDIGYAAGLDSWVSVRLEHMPYLDFLYLYYIGTYEDSPIFCNGITTLVHNNDELVPICYTAGVFDVYSMHKYEEYITYLKNNYVPLTNVVKSWYALLDENHVTIPVYPTLTADTDLENYVDYRTIDTDSDGLTDLEENKTYGTDINQTDTDSDGFDDYYEVNTEGFDPLIMN